MAAAIGTILALAIIGIVIGTFFQVYSDKKETFSWKPVIFIGIGIFIFFFGMVLHMVNQLQLFI